MFRVWRINKSENARRASPSDTDGMLILQYQRFAPIRASDTYLYNLDGVFSCFRGVVWSVEFRLSTLYLDIKLSDMTGLYPCRIKWAKIWVEALIFPTRDLGVQEKNWKHMFEHFTGLAFPILKYSNRSRGSSCMSGTETAIKFEHWHLPTVCDIAWWRSSLVDYGRPCKGSCLFSPYVLFFIGQAMFPCRTIPQQPRGWANKITEL